MIQSDYSFTYFFKNIDMHGLCSQCQNHSEGKGKEVCHRHCTERTPITCLMHHLQNCQVNFNSKIFVLVLVTRSRITGLICSWLAMLMTLEYLKNIVGKHKVRKFNMEVIDAVSGRRVFQTIDAFYCWFYIHYIFSSLSI